MPQHPPSHKRQRDRFAEEDCSDAGRHVRKGVSYASYHDVLEKTGTLHEGAAVDKRRNIALGDELIGDEEEEMW